MVECEFLIWNNSQHMPDVLIDTWWNVNVKTITALVKSTTVLIDTWWNVNLSSLGNDNVVKSF